MDTDAIVSRTATLVCEQYVFPEVGAQLGALLTDRARTGRYAVGSPVELADLVTEDLRTVNGDLHLRLKHHEEEIPDEPDEAAVIAMISRDAARTLGGVAKVDRLEGNVAHLALAPLLFPLSMVGDTLAAALQLVAGADALVLDVRDNRGGDPATVAFVCGYLLDEPTHLVTMEQRDTGETVQSWSPAYVPGPRFGGSKPVYVLTGPDTFSGAEELAYDLQGLTRATVVGERTRGGAHPRRGHRLHPHLELAVPVGRAVSPVTGTNWEGVGVRPDVPVAAADALATAHRLALGQ
jgi:C-terminal processing protease CtpA/Prc